MPRPRTYRIWLDSDERQYLQRQKNTGKSETVRMRSKVLLAADENHTGRCLTLSEISAKVGVSKNTVTSTLRRFLDGGMSNALAIKRNENSNVSCLKATGDVEARVIQIACVERPGYARWTVSLVTEQANTILEKKLSRATIGRIMKRNDFRPHLTKYWSVPAEKSAEFVANMEDVLDLYQQPYDPEYPLWCMDEKPYKLLGEVRNPLPTRPGLIRKEDSEYKRNGVASIFCCIQPHTGKIVTDAEWTRTAVDWAEKIKYLVDVVEPKAKKIILVMDNLNVHKVDSLYKAFPPEEARRIARRIEIHYTPKHGSWLDIAEIGLNIITRECLERRIPTLEKLKNELKIWNDEYDRHKTIIKWQFTTPKARIKLKRLYPDITLQKQERDTRQMQKQVK